MSYFGEFDDITEPSKQHLIQFLQQSRSFLFDVIRNRLKGFGRVDDLSVFDPDMKGQAEILIYDRHRDFERIIEAVDRLPRDSKALTKHGLVGPPQKLRLSAMVRLEGRVGFFRSEEIIKKILEDINNILSSMGEALEFALNESGPRASQYRSAFVDAGMGTRIGEIKNLVEILLRDIRRLTGRSLKAKEKSPMPGALWSDAKPGRALTS